MRRYVIVPEVALQLAQREAVLSAGHQLLAPTLFRSQTLSLLYRSVRTGAITRGDADRQLDYVRALRLRLLGDRVLQAVTWKVAEKLGWPDTFDAEYIALTQLQADALIVLDKNLANAAGTLVEIASIDDLLREGNESRSRQR